MLRPRQKLLLAVFLGAVVIAVFLVGGSMARYYILDRPGIELRAGVRIGWTRQRVIEHLGKPHSVIRTSEGYQRWREDRSYVPPPPYPMQKEILIYHAAIDRMYVFIGNDDRVKHVHMART